MLANPVQQHRRGFSFGLRYRHARPEPRDSSKKVRSCSCRIQREWNPDLSSRSRKIETGRHDSHNLDRVVVEIQRSADGCWTAAKPTLPKSVADNADVVVAGRVFAAVKRSSEHRRDIEYFEEIGGDVSD